MTTQEFLHSNMGGVTFREERMAALTFSLVKAQLPGFIAEFGVAIGTTLNHLCDLTDQTVYGFDSFNGLPEKWRDGFEAGAFAVRDLRALRFALNAKIYRGLFLQTLPQFLKEENQDARFIHMDCDLRSSTHDVLWSLHPRIKSGTVIQFDELFGYDGFEEHQLAALCEFCAQTGRSYEYICYTAQEQATIRFK